jgi:hypothetical protein
MDALGCISAGGCRSACGDRANDTQIRELVKATRINHASTIHQKSRLSIDKIQVKHSLTI